VAPKPLDSETFSVRFWEAISKLVAEQRSIGQGEMIGKMRARLGFVSGETKTRLGEWEWETHGPRVILFIYYYF
jgi:hypothetical protein